MCGTGPYMATSPIVAPLGALGTPFVRLPPERPGNPRSASGRYCLGLIYALIFFVLPGTLGLAGGFFGRWWGTVLAAAVMFGLTLLVVEDLEVPDWYIGLWLAGFAAVGGVIGVFVRSRRRRRAQ